MTVPAQPRQMPVDPQQDAVWMRAAVAQGLLGELRRVRPNPRVGCVLVADGQVVGRGYHAQVGGPHAEVGALAEAGERARGATAYVTLEPCNHHGRTPPCAAALVRAGVARVVVGVADPHVDAAGGAVTLRAAGIPVEVGVEALACADVAEVFLTNVRADRAFVHWKVATTLDGHVAAADGTTRWISGPESRQKVQWMRASAGAVLVGGGTALADNPRLDLRDLPPGQPLPLRVVVDRRIQLPLSHHLAETTAQPTWLVTDDPARAGASHALALAARGVRVLVVPTQPNWLSAVLQTLRANGVCEVLCEAGPTLGSALWQAGLVDRLTRVVAPSVLGTGRAWLELPGVATLADAAPWRFDTPELVGTDVWLTARPVRP